jgi:GntR family transcriptional regulator, arabinose operon transcriptional repressor
MAHVIPEKADSMNPGTAEYRSMSFLNDRQENLRKHEVVFRDILWAIRTGKLAPGQRLPNEIELAQRYSVSRNSVRRGLMRLQHEGVVEKRQGSGSYVSRNGRTTATNQQTALAVRYVPQSTESLIGHATGPWWALLREGLMHGAAYHGMQLTDEPCGLGPRRGAAVVLPEPRAGVLIVAFGNDNPSDLIGDLPPDVPRLLVNRACLDAAIPSLTVDRELGAYQATSFLLRLGHRRIGIDGLGDESQPVRDRLRGYRRALETAGFCVDERMLFQGASGTSYLEWPKRLREMLKREPRPTALLMHHDNRILHIMEVLRSEGIRVPEDLSLIIIDDDRVLSHMTPRLSAISDPYFEMGRRAVAMLLAGAKRGQEAQHVALEPQLVMRESVIPSRP